MAVVDLLKDDGPDVNIENSYLALTRECIDYPVLFEVKKQLKIGQKIDHIQR